MVYVWRAANCVFDTCADTHTNADTNPHSDSNSYSYSYSDTDTRTWLVSENII